MKRIVIFCLFLIASTGLVSAQEVEMYKEVHEMFEDDKAGIIVKYYKGKINDLDDVILVIGHNKSGYKGFYRYIESGLTYYLKGSVNQAEFEWIESLDKINQSGILKGNISNSSLLASRIDNDEKFIQSFKLQRIKKVELSLNDCSDGLWLKVFKGEVLDDNAQIILQKENEGQLKGVIQFNDKISTYNLRGHCVDDSCKDAKIFLSNNYGKDLGYFILSHIKEDSFQIVLNRTANNKSEYQIQMISQNKLRCVTYKGSNIAYNYTFPLLEDESFNSWITKHFKDWLSPLLTMKDTVATIDIDTYNEMALAWMDIEFMTSKLISGYITFYNPDDNVSKREAFIYRFRSKENMDWTELFKKLPEAKKKIKYFIQKEKEKMRFNESDMAYSWIKNEPFDDVCIRKDGLCFSTDFNSIFGERKIIMPYVHLRPYLKSKRFILKL